MRVWCARLAAGLMLTAAKGAFAYTCTTVTTSTAIQPQKLSVQRDLPVGGLIAQVVSDVVTSFKCTNEAPGLTYQEVGIKGYGTYVGDFDGKRVWKTNIDGIGYAIGVGIVNGCGVGLEGPFVWRWRLFCGYCTGADGFFEMVAVPSSQKHFSKEQAWDAAGLLPGQYGMAAFCKEKEVF